MANKKYYYLKLKENFFDSDEMLILEGMPEGMIYSNILLKLYLRSLKDEGRLMLMGRIPYSPAALSQVVRHDIEVVEKAIKIFKELNLIDILDNGAMYVSDIQAYIGHTSSEAERKARYRDRIKSEQLGKPLEEQKAVKVKKVSNELKVDKKIVDEIITYLNKKTGKNYRSKAQKTIKHINARINEGYNITDFKTVIDNKVSDWGNTDMDMYLRPETLFGSKFEGYLNESAKKAEPELYRKYEHDW